MLTILEGTTFVVSDEIGDIGNGAEGVFADDTRMLSTCRLRVDGERPLLLTARSVDYFSAAHYLRNAPSARVPADTLSISRARFVGEMVIEHVSIVNEGMPQLVFDVDVEFGADFADILSVKAHDFAFGDPENAPALPLERGCRPADPTTLSIDDDEDGYRTTIRFSAEPEWSGKRARFAVTLGPHEKWDLTFDLTFGLASGATAPVARPCIRNRASVCSRGVGGLEASGPAHVDAGFRPAANVRALDLRSGLAANEGRLRHRRVACRRHAVVHDSLRSRHVDHLAADARLRDPSSQPGRCVRLPLCRRWTTTPRSTRNPARSFMSFAAGKPHQRGSLSTTGHWMPPRCSSSCCPRSGGGQVIPRSSRSWSTAARSALRWIEEFGDRDGDGFIEYERRAEHGLANQSWKDSGDSQRFRDGRLAGTPIAPAECQGYVFDALLRTAELAQHVWDDPDSGGAARRKSPGICNAGSTTCSGSRSDRCMRWRSTATSDESILWRRISATFSGRGSSCPRDAIRSPRRSPATRSGRVGACARWARTKLPTIPSATTTARSGLMTPRLRSTGSHAPATWTRHMRSEPR